MSDNFKRHRRRLTGSTSARFKPSQLIPAESIRTARIGKAEVAACGAVSLVALALVVLIWIVTMRAVQEQQAEIRDRSEQALSGEAATIAETVGHELLLIDQSLTIIQAAWKADSDTVNLSQWQQKMPALLAVSDDVFICDEKHAIRQDILPQAVGQGVGAAYVTFPHGSLERFESDGTKSTESLLLQGDTGAPIDARQFLMYIVRPLDHPKGWLLGASYRSTELTKLFAGAALGFNSVVALVDTRRGVVQAVVGPAARRPKTDLSRTPLFGIMARSDSGTWLGQTGIDGVERIHAFHRVANRDMVVLVAASWAEVMAPANNLGSGARSLAFAASALVLVIAAAVLWELYNIRGQDRQRRILARNKGELQRLRSEETISAARTRISAARLRTVFDNASDGLAIFDTNLRLLQWNRPFLQGIGIQPRPDMPLDTLLREQAAAGLFGSVPDREAEVARRAGILRSGDVAGLPQPGSADENLILRGLPAEEGGLVLVLNGLATWSAVSPAPSVDSNAPAPEPVVPAAIEW